MSSTSVRSRDSTRAYLADRLLELEPQLQELVLGDSLIEHR